MEHGTWSPPWSQTSVTGPLQALQAYLLGYGFDIQDGQKWHRPGYASIPDCTLSLELIWSKLEFKLKKELHWQRLMRLTRYQGCDHIGQPLDWTISLKLQNTTSDRLATAFHQGTLNGQDGHCPLCGAELTFVHLVWECSYWQGKVKELPDEWKDRTSQNIEPEIWNRGISQGYGKWEHLLPCHIDHGHAAMLAVLTLPPRVSKRDTV